MGGVAAQVRGMTVPLKTLTKREATFLAEFPFKSEA